MERGASNSGGWGSSPLGGAMSPVRGGRRPGKPLGRGSIPLGDTFRKLVRLRSSVRLGAGDARSLAWFDPARDAAISTQSLGRRSIRLDDDSARSEHLLGVAQQQELVAHSYVVAGASPATETQHLDVAQQDELVGDNHAVAGATPAIQTTPPFQGRDTILRRSLAEVQILSVARRADDPLHRFLRHRLGRALTPNQSAQRSIRWWRASSRSMTWAAVWCDSRWNLWPCGTANFFWV